MRSLIIILICVIITSSVAYAGDIPESLMSGNQQALFIGKIIDQDSESFTIEPLTVMMGSTSQEEIKANKFEKYYGNNNTPKVGDFLVVVLLNDNKIDDQWVFKSTSADYKTLVLESERYNMVDRYQKYINEGKYFEAQKKIDVENKVDIQTIKTEEDISVQSNGKQISKNSLKNLDILSSIMSIIFLVLVVHILYSFISKRK